MAQAVGLEFGADFVRLCHIEHSAKGYKILHLRQLDFPKESQEEAISRLKELFQNVPKDIVHLCLSSENSLFRIIQVPFADSEQIRKIIKFEAEAHIHTCPIEDILIDFQKIDEEQRPSIFLAGFYKKHLQVPLDLLKQLRIYPLIADLDINGSLSTLNTLSLVDKENSYLIFEIEALTTKILLIDQGKLIQIRVLRFGSKSLQANDAQGKTPLEESPQFILGNFSLSLPLLEEDQTLLPDEQELLNRIQQEFEKELQFSRAEDLLNKIVKETSRTMAALSFKKRPEKIFLFCEEEIPNSTEYFRDSLEMDVFTPRIEGKIQFATKEESQLARKIPLQRLLGITLRQQNPSPWKMNFLQEEFQTQDRFELVKKPLLVLLSLLCLLFFCAGLFWTYRSQKLSKTLETLNQRALEVLTLRFPENVKQIESLSPEAQLLSVKNRLNTNLEDILFLQKGGITETVPTFLLWKNLFSRLKSIWGQMRLFRISNIVISQRDIQLQGWVEQEPDVQLLINTLQKEPFFQNTQLEGTLQKKENVLPFRIRILFPKKN